MKSKVVVLGHKHEKTWATLPPLKTQMKNTDQVVVRDHPTPSYPPASTNHQRMLYREMMRGISNQDKHKGANK